MIILKENKKDTFITKRDHEKLLFGFIFQLFSYPTEEEKLLIEEILEEKIKEKYEKKIEGLKDVLDMMPVEESHEIKENIKKELKEEYKKNLKKEIRDLKKLLKTASSEDEKQLIQDELKNKLNEVFELMPVFKGNSFYRPCVDKLKVFKYKDNENEYAVDNLYAHIMIEFSGWVRMSNGQKCNGLNKKIYFYMTTSLNTEGAGLRVDYLDFLLKNYNTWIEEKRKGIGRPADYVIIFMDEYESKYYYINAKTLIDYYFKNKVSDELEDYEKFYTDKDDEWFHIPIDFIKENSYWIVDAPSRSKEYEEKVKQKLIENCRKPVKGADDIWTMKNCDYNFDPEKWDRGKYIWSNSHYTQYTRGKVQFFVSYYDKDGNKINSKIHEKRMKSLQELFDFVKKHLGYKPNYRTFVRDKSHNNYKKFIDKAIELNDKIIFIQSSENTDIAQDFSKTKLEKVDGQWYLTFVDKIVEMALQAKKAILYLDDKKYFAKRYININYVLKLKLKILKPDYFLVA